MDDTINSIRTAFQQLADQFGLRFVDEEHDRNYEAVRFANGTTGLKVAVDWSELRPFVTVYQLIGTSFPPEPFAREVSHKRRYAFDADDLLLLRPIEPSPVGRMFARADTEAAMPLLTHYAKALQERASDVLSGDFKVLDQLEEIVIEREQRMRKGRLPS